MNDATLASGTLNVQGMIDNLTGSACSETITAELCSAPEMFVPLEPTTWDQTGLTDAEVGGMVLKFLLNIRSATGRRIAEQIKLPFGLVQELLLSLKNQLLVIYRGSAVVSDYEYELTNAGIERAREFLKHSSYCGAAPVALDEYCASVGLQSFKKCRPRMAALRAAFADLVLNDETLSQIGQAVNAGRGMFLYGAAGNGKSVMAERIVRTAGDFIWIPRAISVSGDVIRLFDSTTHEEVPLETTGQLLQPSRIDRRWVRIRRPTVVVGGELTLQQLDVNYNAARGINEAPLQMKSNCGALIIDDFGRQRVSTNELLNRFIVPLEKGCDFVSLPSGRQIQVPFDQMLAFSTNMSPDDLCDEAFLRRIPYKLEVLNPTENQFRELILQCAESKGIAVEPASLEYIVDYYRRSGRPFRFCHPRDLLQQIETYCNFHECPLEVTVKTFDVAVKNYFTGK